MIPTLHKPNEVNFEGMGFGGLVDTIECTVKEEINGAYELNMQILTTDPNFINIRIGSIILAKPNINGNNQAFVVESMSKPIDNVVTIYATHISQHRSKLMPVFKTQGNNLQAALTAIMSAQGIVGSPFTLHSPRTSNVAYTMAHQMSLREVLGGSEGSLLDVYGGEYIFNNFDIELVSKRGRDQGMQVVYGQNMTDFNMDEIFSWNDTADSVAPYWYNETEGYVAGDFQFSGAPNNVGYYKMVSMNFADQMQTKPTKAELNAAALAYITGKGYPSINLKVAFNQFEEHIQGDVKKMNLGDTVTVINSAYGLEYESRIVAYTFNVLSEYYDEIQIGTLETTINQAIVDTVGGTTTITGGSGVTNYNELTNLPQINSVELTGNKSWADLGISNPFYYHGNTTDVNASLDTGLYYCTASTANKPVAAAGYLIVFTAGSRVLQFYTRGAVAQGRVYMRKYDSSWGGWYYTDLTTL